MWSTARVDFGLSTEEFYGLTLRRWSALVRRKEEAEKRRDGMLELMLAQLTAMVGNTGFKGWEEQRQVKEFMPSEWARRSARPKRISAKAKRRIADQWFAIFRTGAKANGTFIAARSALVGGHEVG